MNIGFVYDLKDDYLKEGFTSEEAAEFDSVVTIDAISSVLESMGHKVCRIGNFKSLITHLSAGDRWDMVFNIAEGVRGTGRESLVPALLDAYGIPYTFSSPLVHAVTLDKGVTKRLLRDMNIPVTDFAVIANVRELDSYNESWMSKFPLFVKPVSEGTGKGVTPSSKVNNRTELLSVAKELITTFRQPVIIEPYLAGRETTVVVMGNGDTAYCPGVMEVAFTDKADSQIHSYFNKANCEEAAAYSLIKDSFAKECAAIAVAAHRGIGIHDTCRVDMRADADGRPYIMEINSLPGLMPVRSDLVLLCEMAGYKYNQIIEEIFNIAIKRCFPEWH